MPSYPHPWLMPDFWQYPTVSMGLGPIMSHLPRPVQPLPPRPRPRQDRRSPRVGVPRRRRVRRAGIARRDQPRRPREARQPDLGHQLQPPAARRPRARQRQDHSGTRRRVPRRRLERHQGGLGDRLGRTAEERPHRGPGPPHDGSRGRRVLRLRRPRHAHAGRDEGQQAHHRGGGRRPPRGVHPRTFLQHAGTEGARRAPLEPAGRGAQTRRARPAEGLRRVQGRDEYKGQPTVILVKTVKGYGMPGEGGQGKFTTHQQKKLAADRADPN